MQLEPGAEAIVHCGAYTITPSQRSASVKLAAPDSVYDVIAQRYSGVSVDGSAQLEIGQLSAATTYTVYCLTESFKGVLLDSIGMLSLHATAATACCKTLYAAVQVTSLHEGSGSTSVISFSLDALPSLEITVAASIHATSTSPAALSSRPIPHTFLFSNTSLLDRIHSLGWIAGPPGSYRVAFSIAGPSAAEFEVSFTEGVDSITVRSLDQEPPTPIALSARFTPDGSSVFLVFDARTNRGGFTNSFTCSALLQFSGIEQATCRWTDSRTIIIYPSLASSISGSSEYMLGIGSNITVVAANSVTAECTEVTGAACTGWSSVPETTLQVAAPTNPITPTVQLVMPSVVSSCAGVTVDLTMSTGSGGRPWLDLTVSVQSDDAEGATAVEALLNTDFHANTPPTTIPSHHFAIGATYSFSTRLCNFLGACGQATRAVLVYPDERLIPFVTIQGSQLTNIRISDPLLLSSDAYTVDCNGTLTRAGLEYTWTVSLDGVSQPGLVSISQDSSKLRLAPFALSVRRTYEVRLTVRSLESGLASDATALVYVQDAPIVADLVEGIARTAVVSEEVIVDASTSYDGNVRGVYGLASSLIFSWTCTQLQPVFSFDCALNYGESSIESFSGDKLYLFAEEQSINSTSRVTVTVSDGRSRSSSTYIDITVRAAGGPESNAGSPVDSKRGVVSLDREAAAHWDSCR